MSQDSFLHTKNRTGAEGGGRRTEGACRLSARFSGQSEGGGCRLVNLSSAGEGATRGGSLLLRAACVCANFTDIRQIFYPTVLTLAQHSSNSSRPVIYIYKFPRRISPDVIRIRICPHSQKPLFFEIKKKNTVNETIFKV